MKQAQDAHGIAHHIADQDIVAMNVQFARTGNASGMAESRMGDEVASLVRNHLIQRHGRTRYALPI